MASATPAEPTSRVDTVHIATLFAERLSRIRALTCEETELLARLMEKLPAGRPLRRWTAAQDSQLRHLLALGHTAPEIGVEVGRTTDAIHTRVKRLKMKERHDG